MKQETRLGKRSVGPFIYHQTRVRREINLKPDYGLRLKKEGYTSPHVEHVFYGLPSRDLLTGPTPANILRGQHQVCRRLHCLSLDFGPGPLATILAALPANIRQSIETQLAQDPHIPKQFNFPHPVYCESVTATLGEIQHAQQESFVPLNVREMKIRTQT